MARGQPKCVAWFNDIRHVVSNRSQKNTLFRLAQHFISSFLDTRFDRKPSSGVFYTILKTKVKCYYLGDVTNITKLICYNKIVIFIVSHLSRRLCNHYGIF